MVFWNRVGFGVFENATSPELLCSIRCRPTWPEPLPRPAGCRSDADASSSAAELIAPAARTTTSAVYSSRTRSRPPPPATRWRRPGWEDDDVRRVLLAHAVPVDHDPGDGAPGRIGLQSDHP